jgi:enterochelin esterase-like enzyme
LVRRPSVFRLWSLVVFGLWSSVLVGQDRPAPYVDGREVTFVATGDPSDPPRIVADFNGWDPAAGVMTRTRGTGLYALRLRLDPAARIEYLIAYRERFEVDPRNPLRVPSPTGAPRSELRMPGYISPAPLPRAAVPGLTQNVPFTSKAGESRRVRVHRPRDASGPLPILYIHDGIIADEGLGMPEMIDSLIGAGRMAPITAVFINSVDRYDDYAVGSMFSYVFTGEIVPAIEQRYQLSAGARYVLGFSRSTVGALDAALNSGVPFAGCGLVAPAMNPPTIAALVKPRDGTFPRVTIAAGTYDIPLIEDARALRQSLESRGVPLEWIEVPEGHNHTAWKAQLPRLLTSWFPPTKP